MQSTRRFRVGMVVLVGGLSLFLQLGVANRAHATLITLDFEDLRQEDNGTHQIPFYAKDGFLLTPSHSNPGPAEFVSPGTLHPVFPGSTTIWNGTGGGGITLAREDGGLFNLLSIDLVELPTFDFLTGEPIDQGPFDVTFFGTQKSGTIVTNTFTVTEFFTLDRFSFSGFANLVSVHWAEGSGGGGGNQVHQFDNIRLVVPEPSSFLLLGSSLALVAGWRRLCPTC